MIFASFLVRRFRIGVARWWHLENDQKSQKTTFPTITKTPRVAHLSFLQGLPAWAGGVLNVETSPSIREGPMGHFHSAVDYFYISITIEI